jgi:hypothetical protein
MQATRVRAEQVGRPERRGADILLGVTSTMQTLARRTSVLLLFVVALVLGAAPAHADVPVGWTDESEAVDPLHAILVLAGIPLALFVIITIAVLTPSLVRGEGLRPGAPAIESQWFGGPRKGTHVLESGSDAPTSDEETGGASGRW